MIKIHRYILGIDPGVSTGFSAWDRQTKSFLEVGSTDILSAIDKLRDYASKHPGEVFIRIEDPNQRKWFGHSGREKLQGSGSVKRDFKILMGEIKRLGIPFHAYHPKDVQTKVSASYFKKLTGWEGRTNSHSRDSALAVFGF